jgi:hypothetical protein
VSGQLLIIIIPLSSPFLPFTSARPVHIQSFAFDGEDGSVCPEDCNPEKMIRDEDFD